ncbi:MAG: IS1634 family transposase, partial [Fibrobacterota bacterium]
DLAVAMIVARIIEPCSKLATARDFTGVLRNNSLGETLHLGECNENDLYAAMDWLVERQPQIEKKLAARHLVDGSVILYDISTVYYTGTHCDLARFCKGKERNEFPQIMFGLICNAAGCPVAVEVFPGRTPEADTLEKQLTKIRERFGIKRIIFVGDRGILTETSITEEMRGVAGLDWITALRAPAIRKLVDGGALQLSLFDERDMGEITSPDFPGERLVVCRNPFLAEQRAATRASLLRATEVLLDEVVVATQRKKSPLRGKDIIGVRVGKFINKYKVAKHFILTINEDSFAYARNQEKIAREAALDGFYVLRTSVKSACLDTAGVVSAYKGLSVVERAFRAIKTMDLLVRPIYHHLDHRVRSHIFICMLAYYVEWHMREVLAPVLFDEDDWPAAEAQRASVVAPAQRSPHTKRKVNTRHTDDGTPTSSFQALLKNLATICKNRTQVADGITMVAAVKTPASDTQRAPFEFDHLTVPTANQRKIFELLGVTLR